MLLRTTSARLSGNRHKKHERPKKRGRIYTGGSLNALSSDTTEERQSRRHTTDEFDTCPTGSLVAAGSRGIKKKVFWLFEEKLLITRNEDNQIVYGTRDCALQTGIGRLKLNGG